MHQRGFTMLIAVVTGTILLLISFGMASIALKQQVLNSSARESQVAFYAADSGLECALYLDTKFKAFAASDAQVLGTSEIKVSDYCGENQVDENPIMRDTFSVDDQGVEQGFQQTFNFQIDYGDRCAKIEVSKSRENTSPIQGQLKTMINARGYNTACSNTVSLRRVERGVQAIYYEAFEVPTVE